MNKAYKFRIYPDEEQKILISKTFGCVRFIYNKMLGDKTEYEWLKEVDSLALANAQMNLQDAYNNFFRDKKVGFPKFKSKKGSKRSYTTNCVNGNIIVRRQIV